MCFVVAMLNNTFVNRIVMLMYLRHQINDFDRLLKVKVTVTFCSVLKRFACEFACKALQNRTKCTVTLDFNK